MLSMKGKAFLGIVVLFVAVIAASVVIPVKTFELRLVTSPAEDATYVPAGQPFNVTCEGLGEDGGKFSSMKWLDKQGKYIPEGVPGAQNVGKNSIRLMFTSPKISQSGVYKCSAIYDGKHTLEKSIKIIFYGPKPTFESTFENITAEEGSKLEVVCSATGDLPIVYEWYQDDDKVPEDTSSSIFAVSAANQSTLVIRKVTKSHQAMYNCLARNEHGLSNKVYELTVISPSGNESDDNGTSSILKVEVRNITSTSVKFSIVVSGSVKSIEVKYKDVRNETEYGMEWDYGDNYEVKDLVPSSRYTFRFRTVPSKTKNWSQSYAVTLLPDKPEVIFQNVRDGTVKLYWFRKVDDIMKGTIDSYELKYFSVGIQRGNYWVPSTCITTIKLPSCAGSSYIIAGLAMEQHYEIQVRAHTAAGYGETYRQKVYITR